MLGQTGDKLTMDPVCDKTMHPLKRRIKYVNGLAFAQAPRNEFFIDVKPVERECSEKRRLHLLVGPSD